MQNVIKICIKDFLLYTSEGDKRRKSNANDQKIANISHVSTFFYDDE